LNQQVEEDVIDRACSMNLVKRNAYRILVGMSEGKRPLGRPRRTWVNNIKMVLRGEGLGDIDFIDQIQGRDRRDWAILTSLIRFRVGISGGLL
jgi:hypothetical protein